MTANQAQILIVPALCLFTVMSIYIFICFITFQCNFKKVAGSKVIKVLANLSDFAPFVRKMELHLDGLSKPAALRWPIYICNAKSFIISFTLNVIHSE